jgi:phosphate:Na+ symporter
MNRFAGFISRITGGGSESAASRLEPALYDAGGAVALEAGHRAILEIARGAIDAVRRRLGGEPVTYMPPSDDVRRTVAFLESLSLETTDTGAIGPGLVRLAQALDHLERLHEELARAPASTQAWQPPPGFGEGAQALASWLEATQEPEAMPNAGVLEALEKVSARMREECRAVSGQLLEDVALQRVRTPTARAGLEQLAWADIALHHAASVARSLHGEAEE